MTVTDLASDALADTTVAIGRAVAATIPGGTGWQVERCDDASPAPVPTGGTAVVVNLGDAGRLVLVASATLSRAVQVGPPPAEDLIDGIRPSLDAAVEALGTAKGGALTAEAPRTDDATTAITPGPAEVARSVMLLDGDEHVATVVMLVPAAPTAEEPAGPTGHQFPDIDAPRVGGSAAGGPLELLQEVEMGVTAELGRTRMLVREILDLSPGSVIELDRAAGSPVDVLVNGTLIARGEVVVIDEEFGIRVTEVIGYDDGNEGHRS